jgi:outer membrane protein
MRKSALILALAAVAWGEEPLSLRDAVRVALSKNQSIEAATAGTKAAGLRIAQARSAYLPKVNYSESFARSDNPVIVFSSLLTQHLFTASNFQLGPLNRPEALNNFQSLIAMDQVVYDGGQTRSTVRAAELGHGISGEEGRRTQMEVIAGVVHAYYDAVLGAENVRAAREALRSAEADLDRAEAIRSAGMSTDVDVLSIRVHLAAVREQQIRRTAELRVARAALNEVLGVPLDAEHALSSALTTAELPDTELSEYERRAVESRPEARQAALAASLAEIQARGARASLLPQVSLRGAFEADRQRFVTRGGANWLAGVSLRWNVFNGFGDKARIAEAGQSLRQARAQHERADSRIRLQVHRAYFDLKSAEQRLEVAKAAVAMAEESLRITQNRYRHGLSNVTDLLRNETALLEVRTRHLSAIHDQRVAATVLELAAGTLSADSEVLN